MLDEREARCPHSNVQKGLTVHCVPRGNIIWMSGRLHPIILS
jgi:hypothetical protein